MKSLKTRIENTLYQPYGFRYQHSEWNPKLWNKSQSEIKDFLWNRFNTTLDEVEYYSCMVLLYHTIPNKELLIEFKDSKQYQTYWKQADEITTDKTPKTSTETPISFEIKQIKHVNQVQTVTVIGE